VRALEVHGGGLPVTASKPLTQLYKDEMVKLVQEGLGNLHAVVERTCP